MLQNHYTVYTLCLPYTLVACGALVALIWAQGDAPPGALESRVAHLLADLKRLTWVRRTIPPLAPFPAALCDGPRPRTPARLIGDH